MSLSHPTQSVGTKVKVIVLNCILFGWDKLVRGGLVDLGIELHHATVLVDAHFADLDVGPGHPLLHEVALQAVEPRLVGILQLDLGLSSQVL